MRDVAEGIARITTPLPFRPRSVQAYLVRLDSAGWMLVDSGLDTPKAWAALEAGVLEAAAWSDLRLHVVTHMHLDHIGLARRVRHASSIPLAIGRLDGERAIHAAAEPDEEDDYRQALLLACGAPGDVLHEVRAIGRRARDLAQFTPPDHLLPIESTELPGAAEWATLWTPGHTAGHIVLFRARDRVLIAGDAVLPTISPTIGVNRQREDPVGDYLESLDLMDSLRPNLILPGHGEPMAGTERIGFLRDECRAESERVLALLGPLPEAPWTLAERRYEGRELPLPLRMNALRETLAHLERLTRCGAATKVEADGALCFARR